MYHLVMRRDPRVPLVALLYALSFVAVLVLGRLALTTYDTLVGGLDVEIDPNPIALSVGPVALDVPRNMIRNHPFARGSVSELELRMHWPTMEGFSDLRAEAFRTNDDRSTIIYATLRPSSGSLSPQDRLRLVYSRLLAYPPASGPNGLIATPFAEGSGYDGEILYTAGDTSSPFAARCAPEEGGVPASCTVEFLTDNGIEVIYRFRRHLLSRWRAIDAAMRDTVASFMRG
ncbi:hypothetical protein [Microbaculum sp. FT89]|uniref:hypothetical protein n=1 Tax=Microbaculum sp. FT89 TaxID=3447298 RepID=UPI003F5331C8